ncbi:NosD domain-containing protein [Microbulbifer sp. TRSA007]|uniref:NosD domain-containing protein n=1 Tax=Microbulbifer sp. TRSA007 TaxID=3243384 RepID=UPI00403A384A
MQTSITCTHFPRLISVTYYLTPQSIISIFFSEDPLKGSLLSATLKQLTEKNPMQAGKYFPLIFASVLLPALSFADVQCGDTITTVEIMTEDILFCTATPPITISGPSGNLDMNGFTVHCAELPVLNTGIILSGQGAFLSNGTIENCYTGVSAEDSGFHGIYNVLVQTNEIGISLTSNHNFVSGSTILSNTEMGISSDGDFNSILSNEILGNEKDSIVIQGDNVLVSQNTIEPEAAGLITGLNGIVIGSSSGGIITQNTVLDIEFSGILMQEFAQTNYLITGNRVDGGTVSLGFDLNDANADACTSSNIWISNTFTTANPSCLD